MSSMTQARLAPITQRYLSMSMRRQEIIDKSIPPLSASQEYAHNVGGRIYQLLANRYNNHVSTNNHLMVFNNDDSENSRKETNTPTSSSVDNCTLDPETLVNKTTTTITSPAKHRCYHITKYYHHTETNRDLLINNEALNFMNYGASNIPVHISAVQPSARLVIRKSTNMLADFHHSISTMPRPEGCSEIDTQIWNYKWGRSRSKTGDNSRRRRFNMKLKPLVMLGVLGMFRKPSLDELEEERAVLTDEQKMKKMKPIEIKIARGVLSMCDQDYERANQLFHEALHMAQDDNDEERENLLMNLIASNYFESGDYQNAERLFIELMKRMIAHEVVATAPPVLELSLKLASIYSKNLNTQQKALKGFKFVINSLLHNLADIVDNLEELDIQSLSDEKKDELALLGWSYDWFAKHLLSMNDYSGAGDMLQRAFQISSLVLGPLHDQTLILLNDIGTTLAMNDAPEQGQTFIKKAVEGAITNQSKELASFYVNLGLVNLKLRKYHDAKRFCEYSIELAKKNRDHYNTQEVIELSRTCLNEAQRFLDAEGR